MIQNLDPWRRRLHFSSQAKNIWCERTRKHNQQTWAASGNGIWRSKAKHITITTMSKNQEASVDMGPGTYAVPLSLFGDNRRRVCAALKAIPSITNDTNAFVLLQGGEQISVYNTDIEYVFRQVSSIFPSTSIYGISFPFGIHSSHSTSSALSALLVDPSFHFGYQFNCWRSIIVQCLKLPLQHMCLFIQSQLLLLKCCWTLPFSIGTQLSCLS